MSINSITPAIAAYVPTQSSGEAEPAAVATVENTPVVSDTKESPKDSFSLKSIAPYAGVGTLGAGAGYVKYKQSNAGVLEQIFNKAMKLMDKNTIKGFVDKVPDGVIDTTIRQITIPQEVINALPSTMFDEATGCLKDGSGLKQVAKGFVNDIPDETLKTVKDGAKKAYDTINPKATLKKVGHIAGGAVIAAGLLKCLDMIINKNSDKKA